MTPEELLRDFGHTVTRERVYKLMLLSYSVDLRDVRLVTCADERTGRRFGLARCRRGRCARIGGTTYRYQLWAVWDKPDRAPEDIHDALDNFPELTL